MHGNGAATLAQWQYGAQLVLDYMKQGYTAWIGHLDGRQTYEQPSEIFRLVQEIIDKRKNGQLTQEDSPYSHKDAVPEIRFQIDRIL